MLDDVLFDISPDGTYQLVESLLLQLVRGEGSRELSMVSVVKRRDMRTHGADASSLSLDWWVGGSDIEGLGSPI